MRHPFEESCNMNVLKRTCNMNVLQRTCLVRLIFGINDPRDF